jgi:hypothetical protein
VGNMQGEGQGEGRSQGGHGHGQGQHEGSVCDGSRMEGLDDLVDFDGSGGYVDFE